MSQMEILNKIKENYNSYHVPSMANIHRIKRNAVFINRKNDILHEIAKLRICYNLQYFLTEAESNKTGKRHDVVDLITGQIYECVFKHESDKEIKEYRENGIIPVIVGDKMVCRVCNLTFPKRKKDNICQVCSKELKVK